MDATTEDHPASASAGFDLRQRRSQGAYLGARYPGQTGFGGAGYRLLPEHFALNLSPSIREEAPAYFAGHGITWHQHCNHGLSSQVCCLNFLMPLARAPGLLSRLVGRALGIEPPEMLPIDEAGPEPHFVGFEWIGRRDHLNEAAPGARRTRGANVTSADAILRFRAEGRVETLLVEWKYTEHYGQPIPPAGNPTRRARYADIAFAPEGPIRADLGLTLDDFFWEPFYQLLRQQTLALRMERAREDDAERVRVLHVAPAGNLALRKVTAPALARLGPDALAAFRAAMVRPNDLVSRSTEWLFAPLLASDDPAARGWASYIRDRYSFLQDAGTATAEAEA